VINLQGKEQKEKKDNFKQKNCLFTCSNPLGPQV